MVYLSKSKYCGLWQCPKIEWMKKYKPEELIGRKIIVVANLAPARMTGVTSEGMLLAGTNNACGCQVIFVDDIVPEGTRIC